MKINRSLLFGLGIVLVAGGVFYALSKPRPLTSQQRQALHEKLAESKTDADLAVILAEYRIARRPLLSLGFSQSDAARRQALGRDPLEIGDLNLTVTTTGFGESSTTTVEGHTSMGGTRIDFRIPNECIRLLGRSQELSRQAVQLLQRGCKGRAGRERDVERCLEQNPALAQQYNDLLQQADEALNAADECVD